MTSKPSISPILVAFCIFFSQQVLSAPMVILTVLGAKQGKFHGDSTAKGKENQIIVTGFSFEVDSPRNISTGQASGKRQHQPIVINKEWDAASPQFLQALITNETLDQVVVEVISTAPNGSQTASYTITLKNAFVTGLKQSVATSGNATVPTEAITLTYQSIEEEDLLTKQIVIDDVLEAL